MVGRGVFVWFLVLWGGWWTAAGSTREGGSSASTGGKGHNLNRQVLSLPDNSWLRLPTPQPHPITRSSSPYMPYAPEAGVGILWGASHAGYHNDLWTYDLAHNLWREMLPTEPSARRDPGVIKLKDGLIMTRNERPLAGHQWGFLDYDPDRRVLWKLPGVQWQGIMLGAALRGEDKRVKLNFTLEDFRAARAELAARGFTGPTLWKYDLKTNRWSWVHTKDPTACTRYGGYIRYFPPLRKLIMTPKWVSPNEERENFKIYDPDTNTWQPLKVTWKPIEEGVSRYWVYGHAPIVYHARLKVLVCIFGNGGVWLLDPVERTMKQVIPKARSLPANLDGPVGAFVYDSANATVLAIFADYKTYRAGKQLSARGFPTDRANVWALDLERKAWVLQPPPTNGIAPPVDGPRALMVHHFYDPRHNATVIYRGPYNGRQTEIWVYRYRRARRRTTTRGR